MIELCELSKYLFKIKLRGTKYFYIIQIKILYIGNVHMKVQVVFNKM